MPGADGFDPIRDEDQPQDEVLEGAVVNEDEEPRKKSMLYKGIADLPIGRQFAAMLGMVREIDHEIEHGRALVEEGVPIRTAGLVAVELSDFDLLVFSVGLQLAAALGDTAMQEEAEASLDKIQEASWNNVQNKTDEERQLVRDAETRIFERQARESMIEFGVNVMGLSEEEAASAFDEQLAAAKLSVAAEGEPAEFPSDGSWGGNVE